MPLITCPHCGTSRNMPWQRLPNRATNARCPRCCRNFPFDPTKFQAEKLDDADSDDCVTCPHCGLLRQLPGNRKTDPQAILSCRRCRHSFRLEEGRRSQRAALQSPQPCQLMGVGALLTASWDMLCRRGWSLLSIYLLAALLIFTPLLLAAVFLPELVMGNLALAWACLLAGGLYGCFGLIWMVASLFQQVVRPQRNIRQALLPGWQTFGKFAWLLLLLLLTIGGGSLLLLGPGILFTVWFFFSHYVLAEEGTGGLAALEKSRQLVRGHWWAVFSRILLLVLVSIAISTLAGRLPLIGTTVNFVLTLLLTPFSLLYTYLLYQDLTRCQVNRPAPVRSAGRSFYLGLSTLGWLVIPGVLLIANQQDLRTRLFLASDSVSIFSELTISPDATLEELTEEQGEPPMLAVPESLSAADYNRLLARLRLSDPERNGVSLGPATLENSHFWAGPDSPQLWLKLKLAELPNLAISSRRSTRILIERVNDSSGRDLYNRNHSFETAAFQWVDVLSGSSDTDRYSGTRSVYLKQGTQPEQVSSIRGTLELNLPLGIESRQLGAEDVGRRIQLAGKTLTLDAWSDNRISLTFQGQLVELLSIRAFNQQKEPLRESGVTWQQTGGQVSLQQLFNGKIDAVTILVAADSLTRRYPFDIGR
jgi:hypothetical protein